MLLMKKSVLNMKEKHDLPTLKLPASVITIWDRVQLFISSPRA